MAHPLAAGVLCIARSSGRVLLLRRSSRVTTPNVWALPAGRQDPGEDPLNAAVRELREETGYGGPLELISVLMDDAFTQFDCVVSKEFGVNLNWENDAYGWFEPSALPQPLHPGMRRILRRR